MVEAAAQTEVTTPERCENCTLRPPVRLVAAGSKKGAAGLPVPVWLCGECISAIPKPKRKTNTRRTPVGRHGKDLMRIAYRVGGGTATMLGAFLLRAKPKAFAGRKDPLKSAVKAAHLELHSLRRAGLMKSVGVWRAYAVGERRGKPEEYYYLVGEGIAWGGSLNSVGDRQDAIEAYKLHQLPLRAEHSSYRNDIYLRLLEDAEATGDAVSLRVEDLWGESWEHYPYACGKYAEPSEGEEMTRRKANRRKYEWLYPDGRPVLRWDDGLVCEFDIEVERESGAREAARKIDRYAAYWSRLYAAREREHQAPRRRPLVNRLKEIETRLRSPKVSPQNRLALINEKKEIDSELAALDAEEMGFLGLPERVAPVVFVHQTRAESEAVLRSLAAGRYRTPRYDDLREYLMKRAHADAERDLRAILTSYDGQPIEPEPGALEMARNEAAARVDISGLFAFMSWEELQQTDIEIDLVTGEEYASGEGQSYAPVWRGMRGKQVSLRGVAEYRRTSTWLRSSIIIPARR